MTFEPLPKVINIQWFLFLVGIIFIIASCTNQPSPEASQRETDSLKREYDSLNANAQQSNQAATDSINKSYLDSFSKHVDTNNAEFGNHR